MNRASTTSWTRVMVAATLALAGCSAAPEEPTDEIVEEHTDSSESALYIDRSPGPNICFGTCPHSPDFEPLGQLCTLDRQTCSNGILTCYYKCTVIEPPPYALAR